MSRSGWPKLLRFLVGVVVLVGGLACLGLLLAYGARDVSLWLFGHQVEGVILDQRAEPVAGADPAQPTYRYFVRYEFRTNDGQVITGTARVGGAEWGGLEAGAGIQIVYFPPFPWHNRLDESRYAVLLACAYVPFLFLAGGALATGLHLVRGELLAWGDAA